MHSLLRLVTSTRVSADRTRPRQRAAAGRSWLSLGILLGLCGAGAALAETAPASAPGAPTARPRHIILFIGDGMGLNQVQAAAVTLGRQQPGLPPEQVPTTRLSFENFPVYGYLVNAATNSYVPDSAAAGTALACGVTTNNGMIGVTPDGKPAANVTELAHRQGLAVGVVSSVGVDHATPACFYAHAASRGQLDEIMDQALATQGLDVLFGGGVCAKDWSAEKLAAATAAAGWSLVTTANLNTFPAEFPAGKRVLGVFDDNNNDQLDFAAGRPAACREPRLPELALLATKLLLSKPQSPGFFLMVEGGAIDWAGHANKLDVLVGEVLDFDASVRTVMAELARRGQLEQTLIIVTADHETGGLAFPGPYGQVLTPERGPEAKWAAGGHTATAVPLWASGPGAELLGGKHNNSWVGQRIAACLTPAAPAAP